MAPRFYSQRNGEYVYDVTVAKDETVTLALRYRAHLSNAQRLEGDASPKSRLTCRTPTGQPKRKRCGRWTHPSMRGVEGIPKAVRFQGSVISRSGSPPARRSAASRSP